MIGGHNDSYPESAIGDTGNTGNTNEPQQNVKPEQVPFKDLESLFVKQSGLNQAVKSVAWTFSAS